MQELWVLTWEVGTDSALVVKLGGDLGERFPMVIQDLLVSVRGCARGHPWIL